jgi:hypothetical protein
MTGYGSQYFKAALAVVAAVVILARHLWRRSALARGEGEPSLQRAERLATGSIVVLALLAVGNYFGFSTRPLVGRDELSAYDLSYYYLNTKYFDELGYTHLYEAVVVADGEMTDRFGAWRFGMMRDLDTSSYVPISKVRAQAARTKARFTPDRWRSFKHDFRYFQRRMRKRVQRDLLNDHGYNGPPLLQAFAGLITNRVPVESVKALCHVETLLIVLLFVVMARIRGPRVAALGVLWYFLSFSARWPGVGFGIFRIDWFIALVLACLLLDGVDEDGALSPRQRLRLALAGLLVAYSAMMKIFPAVWLFGLGARSLWSLVAQRRVDRVGAHVIGAFLAGSTVLGAIAYGAVGRDNVAEFAEDIGEHLQPMNLSQQRMGFGIALAYRGELAGFEPPDTLRGRFAEVGALTPVRYGLALLALRALGLTIRPRTSPNAAARTTAAEATELGFVPFYFLMIASHYYWIHRMTMVLHESRKDADAPAHAGGLAALFLIEAFMNAYDQGTHFRYGSTAATSLSLGLYCVFVIGTRVRAVLRARRANPSGGATPGAPRASPAGD